MRAVRIHECGGLENVRLEEVGRPECGPEDAIVEVRAAALNHLDIWVCSGTPRPPLPHTLGSDAAGVVVEVGRAVQGLQAGDEVLVDPGISCGRCAACLAGEQSQCETFGLVGERYPGAFADYLRVPASNCYPRPRGYSWEEAAAFPLVFLTAYRMLSTRAQLRAGESVLIVGVGGGVSTAALSLARAIGARAIVTSSSDEKIARACALGAAGGVNYRSLKPREVARAARDLNGSNGFDVVVDSVGEASWPSSLAALRKGGRLVTCGATTGGGPPADLQRIFWHQLSILGSTMGTPREMREVLRLANSGLVRPVIDSIHPLEAAREAMARLAEGRQFGKIVLRLRP